ncbi:MAG: hypothetical protein IPL58_10885 [Betaproteobacteria bacterium]|uniref:Uncharacterized protein n=1 Tax=Candidatus Proximibacter danicus TaxID=2954365 RepID=A0A9D7PSC4_9PROT|nr:hypothetical protein [Candidatus Proximibacter danicus]
MGCRMCMSACPIGRAA